MPKDTLEVEVSKSLLAEIDRLREALEKIALLAAQRIDGVRWQRIYIIARSALEEG